MQVEDTVTEVDSSEDIQARTYRGFTKVKCLDVYGLTSFSEDHVASTDLTANTRKLGLHIEFPNGETTMLTASLEYLCHKFSEQSRQAVLEQCMSGGDLWISQDTELSTNYLFPKMRQTMVAPNKDAVDGIHDYIKNSRLTTTHDDKVLSIHLSLLIGLFVGSVATATTLFVSANPQYVLPAIAAIIGLPLISIIYFDLDDKLLSYIDKQVDGVTAEHMWMSESDNTSVEGEPITALTSEFSDFFTTFSNDETAYITNVSESHSTAELELEMNGNQFTVKMDQPRSLDHDQPLANLVSECGVGSVKMLDGEKVTLSVEIINPTVSNLPVTISSA